MTCFSCPRWSNGVLVSEGKLCLCGVFDPLAVHWILTSLCGGTSSPPSLHRWPSCCNWFSLAIQEGELPLLLLESESSAHALSFTMSFAAAPYFGPKPLQLHLPPLESTGTSGLLSVPQGPSEYTKAICVVSGATPWPLLQVLLHPVTLEHWAPLTCCSICLLLRRKSCGAWKLISRSLSYDLVEGGKEKI